MLCSLASPATHGLGAVRVYPSNGSMLSITPDNGLGYIPGEISQDEERESGSSAGRADEEGQQAFKNASGRS